ncbi:hypothetical protein OBCHQ24_04535 [Oceanobacillus iheyensis]|nr:hypothetical protein OBCHQ24_04535 [Oceanobacillus iheyensis]
MKKIVFSFLSLILIFASFPVMNSHALPNGNSKGLEGRGIWLTPGYFMESPEDGIKAVDEIADAGFNTIFLEMNRHGYAEYDSDILPIQEPYTEFDPAQLVLDRAKERGLEVHAYYHTLRNPYLVRNNPEWGMERVDREAKKAVVNGELTKSIDKINGSRSSNQLVMYTPEHGETTGTNIYGAEVIVDDGVVVHKETYVGNAAIPENGFVLSGTGAVRTWLEDNVQVGDTITIEDNENALVSDTAWMEPGNEEVITEIKRHMEEILTKYDFDGFHFDHVRYPPTDGMVEYIFDYILEGNPSQWSTDVYGYSEGNRDRFESEYGVDPLDITVEDEELFLAWWDFRSDNITNLVSELTTYAKSFDEDLVMSAALTVRPAYDDWDTMYSGVDYKKLSYPLDVMIPMAYHLNAGEAEFLFPGNRAMWIDHVTKGALNNLDDRAMLYMGIGGSTTVHEQWTSDVWNNTIDIARNAGAHGTVAFEYIILTHHRGDTTNFESLSDDSYKTPAKPMHSVPGLLKSVREKSLNY